MDNWSKGLKKNLFNCVQFKTNLASRVNDLVDLFDVFA